MTAVSDNYRSKSPAAGQIGKAAEYVLFMLIDNLNGAVEIAWLVPPLSAR
jgi:hypothetical protein